jgi:hydrogenase maturation protease
MATQIIFVGNTLSGDDGIGPRLYDALKEHPKITGYEDTYCSLLGVMGIDAVTFINEEDTVIVVDASPKGKIGSVGDVTVVPESKVEKDFSIVSQHDLGIEQALSLVRVQMPKLSEITFILITVSEIKAFHDKLSLELEDKIEIIKERVIEKIVELVE